MSTPRSCPGSAPESWIPKGSYFLPGCSAKAFYEAAGTLQPGENRLCCPLPAIFHKKVIIAGVGPPRGSLLFYPRCVPWEFQGWKFYIFHVDQTLDLLQAVSSSAVSQLLWTQPVPGSRPLGPGSSTCTAESAISKLRAALQRILTLMLEARSLSRVMRVLIMVS